MIVKRNNPKKIRFTSKITKLKSKKFQKEELSDAINLFIYGVKVSAKTAPTKRFQQYWFYLHEDDFDYLQWIGKKENYQKSRLDIKSIKNITDNPSFDSKLQKKFGKSQDLPLMLFISYGSFIKDLVITFRFENLVLKKLFWEGLQYLMGKAKLKNACYGDTRKIIAKKLFLKADKDGNKTLSHNEVKSILQKMHMQVNNRFLSNLFKKYDVNKNGDIDLEEFQNLIDDISIKSELEDVFKKYCQEAKYQEFTKAKITYSEFQEFLKKEQKQDISETDFTKLLFFLNTDLSTLETIPVETTTFNKEETVKPGLSFSDFCTFIFSKKNEIFEPEKLALHQDMTHPLTSYYINSSHNTYLLANQLTGQSSTKAYVHALALGCRCVELDCWDGDKGEPVIYHGHTFTSKILFRDTIQTIKDYAFVASPYPVILSIENHCSKEQQDKMAEYFTEIMGDSLFNLPENFEQFQKYPCPDELKYKFVIKDKCSLPDFCLSSPTKKETKKINKEEFVDWNAPENKDIFNYEEDESYIIAKETNFTSIKNISETTETNRNFLTFPTSNKKPLENLLIHQKEKEESEEKSDENDDDRIKENNENKENDIVDSREIKLTFKSSSEEIYPPNDHKFSAFLKRLLTLFGIKLNLNAPRSIWNISSIKECRMEKLTKSKDSPRLQKFLHSNFLRVYPTSTRFDSSNFDPIECFNHGVQFIALNFQTLDLSLLLYMAKFKQNGGKCSGYVLKPSFLRPESPRFLSDFCEIQKVLYIEVISGQQLHPENENDVKDVADPYVEVSIRGASVDEKENKVFKSKVIENNGFNPIFGLKCVFKLTNPELAILVFKVFDREVGRKDRKIGWYAIPYECVRPGYRMVPLLDSNLNQMDFSYLLCKTMFREVVEEE